MLNINPLLVISFANIFSHSVGCLLVLSVVSFAVRKLLSLTRSHLFIFAFVFFVMDTKIYCCDFFFQFIYFCLRWVLVAACGLSLVAASRGYSLLWCAGFSLRWLLLLQSLGSRRAGFSSCGSQALERRLSNCGAPA